MNQRISITLPEKTIHLIDYMATKRSRSHFIDKALKYYMEQVGKADLRERLKQGAIDRAERDLNVAGEWNALEEEAWQKR
ncbi:MAG TPA: hypothetical protein ENK58_09540 [Desulfobacterales bacterium]|nr:MAG: hypothetical protein DRI57_18070 [Deltaproteobacteria bacterium]HHC25630.1 hypothetical protein [Desulfobacterales bacterium]